MIDLSAILDPIPGDSPGGPDLRYDPLMDRMRELRREDDPLAPRGVWQAKLKVADWSALIEAANDALRTRTKDLQVAAWLAEALAIRHGLPGGAAGIDAVAALVERFWETLWPAVGEDGDLDARFAPIEWLNGRMVERILLTEVTDAGDQAKTFHDHVSAQRRLSATPPQGRARGGQEAETPQAAVEAIQAAVHKSSDRLYRRLHEDAAILRRSVSALRAALVAATEDRAPSFAQLTETLDRFDAFVRAELLRRGIDPDPAPPPPPVPAMEAPMTDAEGAAPAEPADGEVEPPDPGGPIRSREHAYRTLVEVARYLERTEPHSPVPRLVMRAVAWGQMSLPELYAELFRDDPAAMFRLLGLGGEEEEQAQAQAPRGRGR